MQNGVPDFIAGGPFVTVCPDPRAQGSDVVGVVEDEGGFGGDDLQADGSVLFGHAVAAGTHAGV